MAARKGRGNTTIQYGTTGALTALTNYCNSAELAMTVDRLESTHFGSTAAESIAGDSSYSISLEGDWDTALDTVLGPDAITTGTRKTAVITFTGSSTTATYTWTSSTTVGAEVQDYTISSGVSDKITFSATLVLSGAPTRSVA